MGHFRVLLKFSIQSSILGQPRLVLPIFISSDWTLPYLVPCFSTPPNFPQNGWLKVIVGVTGVITPTAGLKKNAMSETDVMPRDWHF